MYAGALALGLEGIVAKDAKSPYVEGPVQTWHWQKIKNRNTSGRERWSFGSLRQGNESEHGLAWQPTFQASLSRTSTSV